MPNAGKEYMFVGLLAKMLILRFIWVYPCVNIACIFLIVSLELTENTVDHLMFINPSWTGLEVQNCTGKTLSGLMSDKSEVWICKFSLPWHGCTWKLNWLIFKFSLFVDIDCICGIVFFSFFIVFYSSCLPNVNGSFTLHIFLFLSVYYFACLYLSMSYRFFFFLLRS